MSSSGYGAAGHKNRFNFRVRLDNWVEDAAGLRLAATKKEGTVDYTTQTRGSYVDPKDMPPAPVPPCKIADLAEIVDKNRTGLSYDMIFLHGKKEDFDPRSTYVTVHDLGYSMRRQGKLHQLMQSKDLCAPLKMSLTKKLTKAQVEDVRAVDSFTTTTKEMSRQLADPQPKQPKPLEALPSFGKSSAFTRANQVYVHGDC